MTLIPDWLEQAAAGHACACPRCPQLAAALTHTLTTLQHEMDRHARARIHQLERDVDRLEQQLAAVRRRKGAA